MYYKLVPIGGMSNYK